MGLFATLGETFGQGGLALALTLERSHYLWSETFRGTVEVHGGAALHTVSRLSVRLVEHVDGGKDLSSWNPHEAMRVGTGIAVPPGSVLSYPFALPLPTAGNPSGVGSVARFLWSVEVEAQIAHSLGARTALVDFDLQYPPLSDALKALRDSLPVVAPIHLRSESRHGSQVVFQYAPLADAHPLLDGIRLTAEEIGGEIVGTLQVNPQEHSLADYARSLVHRDRRDFSIRYPSAPLAASRGGPAPPDVLGGLQNLLGPFLAGEIH